MKQEHTDSALVKDSTTNVLDTAIHYLPLGYLYLLILGIAKESIYYGILGINIMSYSNVLDVLLSPIAQLTANLLFPAVMLAIIIFGYFYLKLLLYLQSRKKNKTRKPGYFESLSFKQQWLYFTVFSIFCAFVGFGIGGGQMKLKKIQNQELKINHRLTFENRDVLEVAIIGSNSGFIFYSSNGENNIKISPIQHIQTIEKF